jgi:HEAT repeat protein
LRNRGDDTVPALIKALKDKEEDVPCDAAAALGCIGPEARAAVTDLVELMEHMRKSGSKQAARSLRDIDPETAGGHLTIRSAFCRWLGWHKS